MDRHAMAFLMQICENELMMKMMKKLLEERRQRDHITREVELPKPTPELNMVCMYGFIYINTESLYKYRPKRSNRLAKSTTISLGTLLPCTVIQSARNITSTIGCQSLTLWRNIPKFTKSWNEVSIKKKHDMASKAAAEQSIPTSRWWQWKGVSSCASPDGFAS